MVRCEPDIVSKSSREASLGCLLKLAFVAHFGEHTILLTSFDVSFKTKTLSTDCSAAVHAQVIAVGYSSIPMIQ
jgi:hypothetical protein